MGRRLGVADGLVLFDRVDESLPALQGLTALRLNGCYYNGPQPGCRVRLPAQLSRLQGLRLLALEVRCPAPYGKLSCIRFHDQGVLIHYSIFVAFSSVPEPLAGILNFFQRVIGCNFGLFLSAPGPHVGEIACPFAQSLQHSFLYQPLCAASGRWHQLGGTLLGDIRHALLHSSRH